MTRTKSWESLPLIAPSLPESYGEERAAPAKPPSASEALKAMATATARRRATVKAQKPQKSQKGDGSFAAIFDAAENLGKALSEVGWRGDYIAGLKAEVSKGNKPGFFDRRALDAIEKDATTELGFNGSNSDWHDLQEIRALRQLPPLDAAAHAELRRPGYVRELTKQLAKLEAETDPRERRHLGENWLRRLGEPRRFGVSLPLDVHRLALLAHAASQERHDAGEPAHEWREAFDRAVHNDRLSPAQLFAAYEAGERWGKSDGEAHDRIKWHVNRKLRTDISEIHQLLDAGSPFLIDAIDAIAARVADIRTVINDKGIDLTLFYETTVGHHEGRQVTELLATWPELTKSLDAMRAYRDFLASAPGDTLVEWRDWRPAAQPRRKAGKVPDAPPPFERPQPSYRIDRTQVPQGLNPPPFKNQSEVQLAQRAAMTLGMGDGMMRLMGGGPMEISEENEVVAAAAARFAAQEAAQIWRSGKGDLPKALEKLERFEVMALGGEDKLSRDIFLAIAGRRYALEIVDGYDRIFNAIAKDEFRNASDHLRFIGRLEHRLGQAGRLGVALPLQLYRFVEELVAARPYLNEMRERELFVEMGSTGEKWPEGPERLDIPAGASLMERGGWVRRAEATYGPAWLMRQLVRGETFGLPTEELGKATHLAVRDYVPYQPLDWVLEVVPTLPLPAKQKGEYIADRLKSAAYVLERQASEVIGDGRILAADEAAQALVEYRKILALAEARGVEIEPQRNIAELTTSVTRMQKLAGQLADAADDTLVQPYHWGPVESEKGVSPLELVHGNVSVQGRLIPLGTRGI